MARWKLRARVAITLGLLLVFGMPLHAADKEASTVTMGFYLPSVRDTNRADLTISLQSWADTLAKPFGLKIASRVFEDTESLRKAVERNELQMINSSGMEMVEMLADGDLTSGFVRHRSAADEGLALVVNAGSGIRKFSDLKGKRIVRLGQDRLSEVFLEVQCMKVAGQACRDFAKLGEEKVDTQAVYRVFFGQADAALVSLVALSTAAELNPQVNTRLSSIVKWNAVGTHFGMFLKNSDQAARDLVLRSAQEVLKTPDGRQILEMFKTDSLLAVNASALQPFRDLLAEYKSLQHGVGQGKR